MLSLMATWAEYELARHRDLVSTVLYGMTLTASGASGLSLLPDEARLIVTECLGVFCGAKAGFIRACRDRLLPQMPARLAGEFAKGRSERPVVF